MLRSFVSMSFYKIFFAFFLLLSLGACSHFKKSCLEINWYELGRQDSTLGLKLSQSLSKRQKKCSIQQDSVYAKAYQNGFFSGLREYCNFKTGYSYGFSKLENNSRACPKTSQFSQGYQSGGDVLEMHSLEQELSKKVSQIKKKLESVTELEGR